MQPDKDFRESFQETYREVFRRSWYTKMSSMVYFLYCNN
ncbi:MAG: hypothetical protein UY09_C0003G0004 [Parcubacteria group bacterium GW2011_GWA2_47_8]|nr:MAG: hypothetical protein UY09_C0003G0004 [Parcubacteria group bacterium GW2011_GWA2_47_8]